MNKKTKTKTKSPKQPTPEPEYDNDMRGALFVNKRKKQPTHPDLTGNAEIDGVEYWISAWANVSASGIKYYSLSFNAKDADQENDELTF